MYEIQIKNGGTPKYQQIIASIIKDIESNLLKKNEQLPSINWFSEEYGLFRDTVEKAYKQLRKQGYVTSVQGKGFYINSPDLRKLRVLLIFNKLSSYKKIIYYSFLKSLGDDTIVDLQIHHSKASILEEIIDKNLGKYHYYVVIPHFSGEKENEYALKTLNKIPLKELVFLDSEMPNFRNKCLTVYQGFENDILKALESAKELIEKYERIVLIFPSDGSYPTEIIRGVRYFCFNSKKEFTMIESMEQNILIAKSLFIVVDENDLGDLIKKVRDSSYSLRNEIGIISFNDTTLKELLGVTVVTTDFEIMGKSTAELILEKKNVKLKNPFYFIQRGTL
jgi:DNA-binding transcriptional regulator YhcF (GntR family)